MSAERFTDVRSLLTAFARTMNLINPEIENHHQQTAYLSYMLAYQMGLRDRSLENCVYAALLHDIGSVMLEGKTSVIEIESDAGRISQLSAQMLEDIPGLSGTAEIISICQSSWKDIQFLLSAGRLSSRDCALAASAIHMADAISTMLCEDIPVLQQRRAMIKNAQLLKGREFAEETVDALEQLADREFVWLDLKYNPQFLMIFTGEIRYLSLDRTVELTRIMSRVIDYRSSFTAMHSAGVAAAAVKLAELSGMTPEECKMMRIAGNLHDIGKLTTPKEILEKPGKLTDDEFDVIKEHPYFTRLTLMNINGFDRIGDWAGCHHEKLNGRGYPFKFGAERLDKGSRIVAIADIFSAITEVRPYRDGMKKPEAIKVLEQNAASGATCPELTKLLVDNYDIIDKAREAESAEAGKRYFESLQK